MENETIKKLAVQYLRGKDRLNQIAKSDLVFLEFKVRDEYSKIADSVEFLSNEEARLKYSVDLDDYNQTFDFFRRSHLLISSDNNNSDLMPGKVNLYFRAWHDYVHFTNGFPFDFVGEYKTYEEQSKNLSLSLRQVLFSEIVLQACFFLHYGKFSEVQKIVLLDESYLKLAENEVNYLSYPKTL